MRVLSESLTPTTLDDGVLPITKADALLGNNCEATNVLTFVYDDAPLTGDIALCAPVVAREAREQHKSLDAHYAHLLIHGMLHLQGDDHVDRKEAEAMESRETALLRKLGFANPYALFA